MAILTLKSNNPDFSHLLRKNPASGISLRSLGEGVIFGYYSKEAIGQEYITYFKDGDDEMTFKESKDTEFEYNDYRRFNFPKAYSGMITSFFNDFIKNPETETELKGYSYECVINQMNIYNIRYLEHFKKHYKEEFNISYEELSPKNYRITIKSDKSTIRRVVNIAYLISFLYYSINNRDLYIDSDSIIRCIKVLSNIDAPYFIRYIIKSRIIQSPKLFNYVRKDLINTKFHSNIHMEYGDTGYARTKFITNILSEDTLPIIDIGCNNLRGYGTVLMKVLNNSDVSYYGVDIDKEILEVATKRALNRELDNFVPYESIYDVVDDVVETGEYNIIMAEVFEHIKLKENSKIIKHILNNIEVNKMIITTPNKDFNVYYLFEDSEVRLDDHEFEMTRVEFQDYFTKILKPYSDKYDFEFIDIGDIVDGISATQSILIKKKAGL